MKIMIVATGILGDMPGLSGGEARVITLAKHWMEQGHEIHLLGSKGGEILCRSLGLDVKLHQLSTMHGDSRSTFVMTTLAGMFFPLPRSLEEFNEGIIYSISEQFYEVMPALRLKLHGKQRYKWATVVHWLPPFPPWKRKSATVLNSSLFFISERVGVTIADRNADVLLPVSTTTEADLRRVSKNPSKIFPVDCGVEYKAIQNYIKGITEKKYDAVFMKRLQAVKGIFDLVDIWSQVVQYRPNARLAVIGSGPDGEQARQRAKALKIENNIDFLGIIYDMQQKFALMARSSLFLLPTYEENWAIVIGEAMAASIPVISYDLPELRAVWEDNYVGIPVGDKEAFARKTLQLLGNKEERAAIAKKGHKFVKRYEWEAIARRELKIILR